MRLQRIWTVDFDETLKVLNEQQRLDYALQAARSVESNLPVLNAFIEKLTSLTAQEFGQKGSLQEGIISGGRAIEVILNEVAGETDKADLKDLYGRVKSAYDQITETHGNYNEIDGALAFYKKRKQAGDIIVVVTDRGQDIVRAQLEYLTGDDYKNVFTTVVGKGAQYQGREARLKPSREMYLAGLAAVGYDEQKLKEEPVEVVVIGDRPQKDVLAGHSLNRYITLLNPKSRTVPILLNTWGMSEEHIGETDPRLSVNSYEDLSIYLDAVLTAPEFQVEKLLLSPANEFYTQIAHLFRGETRLLCGDMYESPGVDHKVKSPDDIAFLPSSILLQSGLLKNNLGVTLASDAADYDFTKYTELNRGYVAGNAFRLFYLGGDWAYADFVKGQPAPIQLTREQFDSIHNEIREYVNTPETLMAVLYSVVSVYTSAFNDLGKSVELSKLASAIEGVEVLDHDDVIHILFRERPDLFTGYEEHMTRKEQDYTRQTFTLNFNAASAVQGETTIDHVREFVGKLERIHDPEERMLTFKIAKIHSICDLAGTQGHKNPYGGATYNKFVHPSFNEFFSHIEKAVKGEISADEAYFSYHRTPAAKMGFEDPSTPIGLAYTRIGEMIRGQNMEDGDLVRAAYSKTRTRSIEGRSVYNILIEELGTFGLDAETTSLWMQYSPDLHRILAKENFHAKEPIEKANALAEGMYLFASALVEARKNIRNNPEFVGGSVMLQGYDLVPVVRDAVKESADEDAKLRFKDAVENGVKYSRASISDPTARISFRTAEEAKEVKIHR